MLITLRRNYKINYVLDYSNPLYEKKKSIVTEQGREAFANYVKAIMQRYSEQGAIWEI